MRLTVSIGDIFMTIGVIANIVLIWNHRGDTKSRLTALETHVEHILQALRHK